MRKTTRNILVAAATSVAVAVPAVTLAATGEERPAPPAERPAGGPSEQGDRHREPDDSEREAHRHEPAAPRGDHEDHMGRPGPTEGHRRHLEAVLKDAVADDVITAEQAAELHERLDDDHHNERPMEPREPGRP